MSEIVWEEPPRTANDGRGGSGGAIHRKIAAQLREQPGKWARIEDGLTQATALQRAYRHRCGVTKAFAPAGAFEATGRRLPDGTYALYARYVGEPATDKDAAS